LKSVAKVKTLVEKTAIDYTVYNGKKLVMGSGKNRGISEHRFTT
jgi:hypothetical protein